MSWGHFGLPKQPLSTQIVQWARNGADTNYGLHCRLKALGYEVPDWLADILPPVGDMPGPSEIAQAIWQAVCLENVPK